MLEYKFTFTDLQEKILKHDLLDIKEWADAMILGKVNNGAKRAAIQYKEILIKEGGISIPVKEVDAASALFDRPDYKDRADRDKAEVDDAAAVAVPIP